MSLNSKKILQKIIGILFVVAVFILNQYVTIFNQIAIIIGGMIFLIYIFTIKSNLEFLKLKLIYLYYESGWSFLIRFITIFLFLYGLFGLFIGIAMPGGVIENQFLFEHFNFIQFYTDIIINSVAFILQQFDIQSHRNGLVNLRTSFGGVNIIYGCLAIGVNIIWIAFVVATKRKLFTKIIWLIIGTCSLYVLNIIRICLILFALKNKHTLSFLGMDHHTLYDLGCYLILIILGWIYYKPLLKTKSQL